MPTLKELDSPQIRRAIEGAAERQVPLAISARTEQRWTRLRSRIVAVREKRLLLVHPEADDAAPREFAPAEKLGLSFKLKHYKHIATVTVGGAGRWTLDDGTVIGVLSVCWPVRMQRLQRRAYERVDVPAGRIVRASFWLGGCTAEPSGCADGAPFWSGRVTNISAGGLQLQTDAAVADLLEPGDVVGLHLVFGAGQDAVHTDAQFRRAERTDDGCAAAFQFLGLGQTRPGRRALQTISDKVVAFHAALARRSGQRRAATRR